MKSKCTVLVIVSVISSMFMCNTKPEDKITQSKLKNQAPVVEGFLVKPQKIIQTIFVSGTLKPFEETVLMPEVTGRVVMLNVPEGKFVKQGTVLVKLFDDDFQASLKKSVTQLALAQTMEKRQAELLKVNGISQSDYDQSLLQVNSINADIELIKAQIRKTEIHAPYDGVVGLKNASIGAEVMPSSAITTIRQIDKLKLDFSVPEKYGTSMKVGLKVLFTVSGDETKYAATVMATEQGIEAATRNLKVRAVVTNKSSLLVSGAFANIELQLGENPKALMVPTQAIIPMELNKQVIVCKNGKAVFTIVKTGVRQNSFIEVVSGLTANDTIATTGILFLKPGANLKFSKVVQ